MKINRQKLLKLYLKRINEIAEACEDKSVFSPEECVGLVAEVLEGNPKLLNFEETNSDTECAKIKGLAKKNKLKLAAQLIIPSKEPPYPSLSYITLGILDKRGKFKDFYYNSGLEYEIFQKYIPPNFAEAMESTYEYHSGRTLTEEQYIKEAFDVLEKCGYKRIEDFEE